MKLIHKFKSLNFNERRSTKVNLIIIHYTALNSISESLQYLCAKKNKVSCHYLISKKGEIYNLVSENKRAWHAGKSFWNGTSDINSSSIGIEIDYNPFQYKKYTKEAIKCLIDLLKVLAKKYKIKTKNILGHSDIAPYRKIDPGNNFPWHLLEKKKLAFKINKLLKNNEIKNLTNVWFAKNILLTHKKKILFMLGFIGYDVKPASINVKNYNQLILIYCTRYNYCKKYSLNKKSIFDLVEIHFFNILLTKLKK